MMVESRPHEVGRPTTADELRAWRVSDELDTPGNSTKSKYIVLTEMRSGSTLICDLLRRSGAGTPLEYLNPNYLADFLKRFGEPGRMQSLGHYLDRLYRIRTSPNGYFGMQCVHRDVLKIGPAKAISDFLGTFDRIVLISRRDKLAQAISIMRAQQTGRWESGLSARGDGHETFDPILLSKIVKDIYERQALVNSHLATVERPLLSLEYEIIRDSLESEWRKVQLFLGLEPVSAESLESVLTRQSDETSDEYAQRYLDIIRGKGG